MEQAISEIYITFNDEAVEILEDNDIEAWKEFCENEGPDFKHHTFMTREEYFAYFAGLEDATGGADYERCPASYYILHVDDPEDLKFIKAYLDA